MAEYLWNKMERGFQHIIEKKTHPDTQSVTLPENLNTPLEVYLKTRGRNGGTWMHSYLFIDLSIGDNQRDEFLAR